jgi:nucleoredoxin
MKISTIFLTLALLGPAHAKFETWTNAEGREATMKLLEVFEEDGEKVGKFSLRGGQIVKVRAADLSDTSIAKLEAWAESNASEGDAAGAQEPSVFDSHLDGNLEILSGSRLKSLKDFAKPTKYYVFYYTASWCGPCQQFTPSLVEFYNEHKNDSFEIVLISSDQDEDAMEDYAKNKKMPWPHLELRRVEKFRKEFNHGVTGIPSVIVCETDGKMLGNYRGNLGGLVELVND